MTRSVAEHGRPMTATTVPLNSVAAATSRTNSDTPKPEAVVFTATCPKCKNVRAQRGYSPRSLFPLLGSKRAIEAYCVSCDAFWPISAKERLVLAKTIIESHLEQARAGSQPLAAQRPHYPGAVDRQAAIVSRLPPSPRASPEVSVTPASRDNRLPPG